jgi:hypothetical protein
MSWQAVRWAIHDAPVADATALLVLIAVCERADGDGRGAYPSVGWLADRARCSPRTAQRHLRDLHKEGLLTPGDPALVSGFRADRRPSVWDVDLTRTRDGVTSTSPREHARGDTHDTSSVTPRDADEMTPTTPRSRPRGDKPGTHGVTPVSPNKDLPPTEVNHPTSPLEGGPGGEASQQAAPQKRTDPTRGTRIPTDWAPSEALISWTRQHCPNVGWVEVDRFRDYWTATPGAKGRKTDWDATWRNWARRADEDSRTRAGPTSTTDDRVRRTQALKRDTQPAITGD